ncbi:MAG TPA: hypothetical protein VK212_08240 [Lentimicrobium sp.]|nr:hypothetical protein [Lentimicrobium sp.]
MTFLREIIFLLIPLIILVGAAWYFVRYYLKTEKDKMLLQIGLKNKEIITPVRLQAYERMVLLLERIEPSKVILRNVNIGQTAAQLHQLVVTTINDEFDHNLSQQLYISSQTWDLIKRAHQSVLSFINEAAAKVEADAPASDLARLLLQDEATEGLSLISQALEQLKNEARILF